MESLPPPGKLVRGEHGRQALNIDARLYVDGEKSDLAFDAWCPERTFDNVPWHVTGLPPGEHTVRVVVTGDADGRATGSEVQIQAAVVYGPRPAPRP